MKKQIIISLIGVALLGTGAITYAQGVPSPVTAPTPTQTQVVPTSIPVTTSAPISAKEAKQAKLQGAITKMENDLQVRITNLDSLASRIQTRIGKMQQEGKDVTAATTALVNAQKIIASAKTDLVTLQKRISTMVVSKTPTAGFATVKKSATLGVAAKIKAAHKALVDTIVIMKRQGTPGTVPPAATSGTSTGI
jgi:hypothetical protein